MTTKIILHGGYAGRVNEQNNVFFSEILKDVPENMKVLLVYFAKEKDEYDRMEREDKQQFENNSRGRKLSFEIASENDFIEQIKQSDVVYLHGGQTMKLLETLKKYPDFQDTIKGKIIAGESAGAYVLSSCFYSKTEGGIFKGLGFVPVKTICHYAGENNEKLIECPNGLDELLLKDYEYKVFILN